MPVNIMVFTISSETCQPCMEKEKEVFRKQFENLRETVKKIFSDMSLAATKSVLFPICAASYKQQIDAEMKNTALKNMTATAGLNMFMYVRCIKSM